MAYEAPWEYWYRQGQHLRHILNPNRQLEDTTVTTTPSEFGPQTATLDDLSRLFDDRRIGHTTSLAKGSIEDREQRNTEAINRSLGLVTSGKESLDALMDARIQEIMTNVDIAPFSDEERLVRQQALFDLISEETRNARRTAQLNMSSRGLVDSSQAYEGGQKWVERGAVGKAGIAAELMKQQTEMNDAASRFRESLLSEVTNTFAPLETRLTTLEAMVQAGDIVDPTLISSLLQDALTADIGLGISDDLIQLAREQAGKDTTGWETAQAFITQLFPSAGGLQALPLLGDYFSGG